MYRLTFIALLVLGAVACKKGEEDPAFSLLSRKARLSGEWKLSSLEASGSSTWNGTEASTSTSTATETSLKNVTTYSFRTTTSNWTIKEYSITINKDGTWSKTINADINRIVEEELATTTADFSMNSVSSGTWSFVGKVKGEYKNKERLLMNTTMSETTYGETTSITEYDGFTVTETVPAQTSKQSFISGTNSTTYDLVMLKSSEMKWTRVDHTTDESITPDETETGIYAQTETFVWKQ